MVGCCNTSVKLTDCGLDAMGSIPGKHSIITLHNGVAQSIIVGLCGREGKHFLSSPKTSRLDRPVLLCYWVCSSKDTGAVRTAQRHVPEEMNLNNTGASPTSHVQTG